MEATRNSQKNTVWQKYYKPAEKTTCNFCNKTYYLRNHDKHEKSTQHVRALHQAGKLDDFLNRGQKWETKFWRLFLPYSLRVMSDDPSKKTYEVLNRNYKPIGKPIVLKRRWTENQIKQLSHRDLPDREQIWLYNDGCKPEDEWEKYSKRLALLSKYIVEYNSMDI